MQEAPITTLYVCLSILRLRCMLVQEWAKIKGSLHWQACWLFMRILLTSQLSLPIASRNAIDTDFYTIVCPKFWAYLIMYFIEACAVRRWWSQLGIMSASEMPFMMNVMIWETLWVITLCVMTIGICVTFVLVQLDCHIGTFIAFCVLPGISWAL
jgi:hypothetical protein